MVTCARAVGAQEVVLLRENKVINPPQGPTYPKSKEHRNAIPVARYNIQTKVSVEPLQKKSRRTDMPREGESKGTIEGNHTLSLPSFRCQRDTFSRFVQSRYLLA